MELILASGSPRRLELLRQIGLEPRVVVSRSEEEKTDRDPVCSVLYSTFSNAPIGQNCMHFPQTIHFSASTTGRENGVSCEMAPLGHTLIDGHT